MASTGFESPPQWQWPETTLPTHATFDDLPSMPGTFDKESSGIHHRHTMPTSEGEPATGVKQEDTEHTSNPQPESKSRQRRWLPRTCRICFEVVQPTFETPSEHLPSMFQSAPGVSYVSEDPADGRLLRPCKCKGSSKYVHEGCLQAWRHADPEFEEEFLAMPNLWLQVSFGEDRLEPVDQ